MRTAAVDFGSDSLRTPIAGVACGGFARVAQNRYGSQPGDAFCRSRFSLAGRVRCAVSAKGVLFEVFTREGLLQMQPDPGAWKNRGLLLERLFSVTKAIAMRRIHGTERPPAAPSAGKEEVS